ncbi:MAG: VWA domain-containing protein, partial [Candidatus Binatia bacterium]
LPLLLIPHWLRQRPRPRRVSALFLYQGLDRVQQMRLGGRLRLTPLFLLQLLLLLLVIAALCRPLVESSGNRSALVIDNSASLQTIDAAGESRFATAKRAAAKALDEDPAASWDLFTLSPEPRDVALGVSRGNAYDRLARIPVGSCPHPNDGSVRSFLRRLARQGYSRIHVVTDRQAKSSGLFEIRSVGSPRPNLAITDITVAAGTSPKTSHVNVAVENFSAKPATAPITIEDADGGGRIHEARLDLPAGGSASVATEVPAGKRVRARIDSKDALSLDDQVVTSSPAARSTNVLLVSASGGRLAPLERALEIRLEVVAPEAYRPALAEGRDLVIFHRAAPAEAPPASALYVLPPDMPYLPAAAGRIAAPSIAFPNPTHPAVRYLNSAALRPRSAYALRGAPEWDALAVADGGPVLLGRRSASGSQVVSGFDLLPYLGDRNRPVSILTLNLVSWLIRERGRNHDGDGCSPIGAAESNLAERPELPVPQSEAPNPAAASAGKTPLWPGLVAAALVLLVLEAWFQRGAGGALWILRFAVFVILAVAAFDPGRSIAGIAEKPLVIADVSRSVLPEVRDRELADVRRITGPAGAAIAFGAEPVSTTVARVAETIEIARPESTDIESALAYAAGEVPEGGPLVLLSDGWETEGNALGSLDSLIARRVRVYPIAQPQPLGSNVAVESLSLPAESRAGSAVRAEVVFRSDNSRPISGRLTIRQAGKVLHQGEVKLPPGESIAVRPLLVTGEGLLEFSATLGPVDAAANTRRDDDVAKSWIAVGGRRRILLVGRSSRENRNLVAALSARGFHVTAVATADGERAPHPGGFGALIINDVPMSALPRGYPEEVRDWVRGGGSLLMVGGPSGFGLGGYRGSPIEEALPVDMKERSREEPRNSVALIVDKSGSMREERRIVFAREAARQLVAHLNDRDRLAVIGFDREAFPVIPLAEVGEIRDDFERRIDRLKPAGGTRLFPALVEARRQLLGEEAKKRHIIVLSDGLSEDGETAGGRRRYYDLALALAEQGVTISTVALGREADADFLERLSSYGRGAFHETRDAADLPEIVLGEFREHARERTMREREFQ